LEELLAMTPEERKAAKADLTAAQKKQLHQEFRALAPAAQEEAAKTLLPHRGATANSRGSRAAVGTVSYDTGVAHGFRVATDEVVVGNRFSTPFMGAPHTLTTVTFQLAGNFSSEGILLVFGAPVGATAPVLDQFTLSGFPVNTLISTPLPGAQIPGLTAHSQPAPRHDDTASTLPTPAHDLAGGAHHPG
ncbi:MAG: DUF3106 domain-containing protein, partial [bacterium]|nr:DUF3106 domain-containing protein [bacterium]